jgi:glycosyltransferase involved in cell wall biosynthesis
VIFTIATPCFRAARFLPRCLDSVRAQAGPGIAVEHRVADGGSADGTVDLLRAAAPAWWVSEPDGGPAAAINKAFAGARGDVLAWLNADDQYTPGALARVAQVFRAHPRAAFVFGRCPIVDEHDREIRRGVTRVKEACFPFSCRFLHQCLNYISQPALFFRRSAWEAAGPLREDWVAAWDYAFTLRLWRQGPGRVVPGGPLARFLWRPDSISGARFETQFREEWLACAEDAGRWSPQALAHRVVEKIIVSSYRRMNRPGSAR